MIWPAKPKNLPSGPLRRNFANPWFKDMIPKIFHCLSAFMISYITSLPYPYIFLMMLRTCHYVLKNKVKQTCLENSIIVLGITGDTWGPQICDGSISLLVKVLDEFQQRWKNQKKSSSELLSSREHKTRHKSWKNCGQIDLNHLTVWSC